MEHPNEKELYDIDVLINLEAHLLEAEGQERLMSWSDLSEIAKGHFQSREDLVHHVCNILVAHGYALSIRWWKKDGLVCIDCDRGGTYHNTHTITEESQKRKSGSHLINCPFEVRGNRKSYGSWSLRVINALHNHEPSQELSNHPSCHRFSDDE